MFRRYFKKILLELAEEADHASEQGMMKQAVADNYLADVGDAINVYKIENGYLLRFDLSGPRTGGQYRNTVLVHAEDADGIAQQIIAHYARKKIAPVPEQGELFGTSIGSVGGLVQDTLPTMLTSTDAIQARQK